MRVIISLTTIPKRGKLLAQAINSIRRQSAVAMIDSLRINVPPGCSLEEPIESSSVPPINFTWLDRDYGPVTKLYAINLGELEPDDLVITIDDDIMYKPTWLMTIMEAAAKHPNDALGFSGWNVGGFLAGSGAYDFVTPPGVCDVLEGWAGAAYRHRFFDGVDMMNSPDAFKFVDDVWISSVLNKRGVVRRLIGFPQAMPIDSKAPGLHTRRDFVEMNRNAARAGWLSVADETGPVPR